MSLIPSAPFMSTEDTAVGFVDRKRLLIEAGDFQGLTIETVSASTASRQIVVLLRRRDKFLGDAQSQADESCSALNRKCK
jgi:hypothetical protein